MVTDKVRLIPKFLIILLITQWLLACSAMPARQQAQSDVATPAALPEVPGVELSEDILYGLLAADLAMQRQQYTDAIEFSWSLAEQTRDPRLAEQTARLALFAHKDQIALQAAKLWVELAPQLTVAREALISAYIRLGQADAVQQHLDELLEQIGPDSQQAFRFVGTILQQEQDVLMALAVMESFAARHQDNPEALYVLAYVAMHARSFEQAQGAIDKALTIRPKWLEAMNLKAMILRLSGKPFEAEVYMAGLVKQFPDVLEVQLNYARLLVGNHQLDEALKQYQWILRHFPEHTDSQYIVGLLALQLNQLDLAEDSFNQMIEWGLQLSDAHYYLGKLAELRQDDETAIKHFDAVVEGENLVDAVVLSAVLKARHGGVENSRIRLEQLRTQFPAQAARILLIEANMLADADRLNDAMSLYNDALREHADDTELLYARALLAERMDDLALVEADLLRLIELQPDNFNALNALGYTLADRTDRYEEAYGYIKRALDLKPNNHAILDSMGWVLYRMGRLDEASQYLRRALQVKNDYEVAAHLGEVQWMLGDQQGARATWEQALEDFPGKQAILDVMKRFMP